MGAGVNREDKVHLSASASHIYGFTQGLFVKFYEQSLWQFTRQVRPLKPMLEKVKGGEPIVYGGLPIASFEALLGEGKLNGVEKIDGGWRWPSAAGGEGNFEEWRGGVLSETQKAGPAKRDILAEIMVFNLGVHTPMETMNAVLNWQNFLRNREGAG